MFLVPFLKYFRPYLWRLSIAVTGMFIVGILSVAPLLIFQASLRVFIDEFERRGEQVELPANMRTVTGADREGESTTEEKIEAQLERIAGRAWTVPRDWALAKVDGFKTWYADLATQPLDALKFLVALLIILTIVKGLAAFLSNYHLTHTFFMTSLQIREDIFANVMGQDYLYFNDRSTGWLHSRINSDVKAIQSIMNGLLSDMIQQPVKMVCVLGYMLWLSPTLTLGVLVVVPVVGGLLYYFARVIRKNTKKQKKKADQLSATLTESLNNIRLVKVFGTEDGEVAKFHFRSMELFRYLMARRIAKFGSAPLMEFLGTVSTGCVLIGGAWMIFHPDRLIEPDAFFTFCLALFSLYRPLKNVASITNKYQVARVSAERMLDMLALRPDVRESPDAQPFQRLNREIEFRNLGFRYDKKEILSDIRIRVPVGTSVALVGPSGAGKTTLVNMLARLFDPTDGAILIDDVDLRRLHMDDWRTALAIVTQETVLFDDTVANNIAYGSGEADMERVAAAARAANAHDFIERLDGGKGYATRVGPSGVRLSGGQRQRLAIARAIYRDPQVLILDEATSSLDAKAQTEVQKALGQLMVGCTTFVIAHRISTIRHVDCIYVLDRGRLIESGSHDELVAAGGMYSRMVASVGLLENDSPEDATEDPTELIEKPEF